MILELIDSKDCLRLPQRKSGLTSQGYTDELQKVRRFDPLQPPPLNSRFDPCTPR